MNVMKKLLIAALVAAAGCYVYAMVETPQTTTDSGKKKDETHVTPAAAEHSEPKHEETKAPEKADEDDDDSDAELEKFLKELQAEMEKQQ